MVRDLELMLKRTLLIIRIAPKWNKLPQEVVSSLSLKVFREGLCNVLFLAVVLEIQAFIERSGLGKLYSLI